MASSLFDVPSPFLSDACNIWIYPTQERTSRELNDLPTEEREKVWADLSGDGKISHFTGERDNCITRQEEEEEQLVQLNEELKKVERLLPSIPAVKNYISQRPFRLMFLRSSQGNSAAAAKQIVKHMQLKEALFGTQALSKDVQLEDLSEQDMAALSCGAMQWLSERDRGQRLVYLVRARDLCETKLPPDSLLRAHFYHIMEEARYEQNQRLGFVALNYSLDNFTTSGAFYELVRRSSQFEIAMPLRCVAFYIPFQNSPWKQVADVVCHLASPKLRVRMRTIFGKFHYFQIVAGPCCVVRCCISINSLLYYGYPQLYYYYYYYYYWKGSYTEVMHALLNLGIRPDAIPINEDGEMDLSRSKEWIEKRRVVAK
jgi:hypothetical protein